jgi:peptidoglycan hydrolase-like protein with peptidoglycan-binding domain
LAIGCVALLATTAFAQDTASQPTTPPASNSKSSTHKASSKRKKSHKSVARTRGQKNIDPQRAHEIQEALIREHYLDGKATGVWNDSTQQAMQRYQAANGWQSKTTPDARALIKLGLGPDHQHLLNPESAMTTQPQSANSISTPTPVNAPDREKQQR